MNSKTIPSLALLLLSTFAALPTLRAEELSDDQITRRLAELVLASEAQIKSGHQEKALEDLQQAKELAANARRPEERQIDARIQRVKEALADTTAQKAEPVAEPAAEPVAEEEKPKPDEEIKGILLSQKECIEIAMQNNLGLKLSELTDRASDIGLRQAWAKYLPTFSGSIGNANGVSGGSHTNTTTFSNKITQNTPWGGSVSLSGSASEAHPVTGTSRASSVGVSASQPLWKGAGLDVGLHDIRAAKLNKLISRGNLELDVQALIFAVRQAYADCIRQLQARAVNRNSVESAQTFLRLTRAREAAGQVTKLDVFNAEVQLADRELALVSNERQLDSSFDRLKQIMDVDLEEKIDVELTLFDFGEKPPEGEEKAIETDEKSGSVVLVTRKGGKPAGDGTVMFQATHYNDQKILDEALANRIELLNSRRNMAIQKLNALLAKDGLGHQIDLVAGYSRSGRGGKWSDTFDLENDNASVGLEYSIPWGKVSDRSAYEKALLDLQRSEIELKRSRTQVHLEVRDILRTLRETEKSTLIQGKKVEQAKRSVEAAQISFERGLKDSFDVIRAEDSLLAAKTDFINRRLDYEVRLAQLEQVVGKATGRVDLSAQLPGGLVESHAPDATENKPLPKSAPTAEPSADDDPFTYERKTKKEEGRVEVPAEAPKDGDPKKDDAQK
ncbi:MAG: TolC family protein [Planctomycetota bacterium]|nr:TolC family protein [Planctomycetota bacterium]